MTIKVAHITLSMGVGGAEILLLNLLRKVDSNKYSCKVICLDEGGDLLKQVKSIGLSSIIYQRKPGIDWKLIIQLTLFFRKERFDIVHSHNQGAHFYTALAGKLAGVPAIITTEHSRHKIEECGKRRFEKRFLAKMTNKWVTVNEELADLSIKADYLSAEKVEIITNGIDCEYFDSHNKEATSIAKELRNEIGIPLNAKVIIMIARLHPVKNHKLLLDAFASLIDEYLDISVVLAGDGPIKEELRQQATNNNIMDKVHFLGPRKDIRNLLWMSDIFVLCSKSEGLPLSLLEACAAEVPVVITTHSNRAGFIENFNSGIVCEGTVEGLKVGLETALKNINECKKMAKTAQFIVKKNYSLNSMVSNYSKLYDELTKSCS